MASGRKEPARYLADTNMKEYEFEGGKYKCQSNLFCNGDKNHGRHGLEDREHFDGGLPLKELYLHSVKLLCY